MYERHENAVHIACLISEDIQVRIAELVAHMGDFGSRLAAVECSVPSDSLKAEAITQALAKRAHNAHYVV